MNSAPSPSHHRPEIRLATLDRKDLHLAPQQQVRVPWWSFSMTVIAVGALRLVAMGKASLDDGFEGHPFTLRHLLQHRAGVTNYGGRTDYRNAVSRGDRPWVIAELLDRVDAKRLEFAPGTGWRYSNIGYLYVRQWLERMTGERLGDALQELVLHRMGLSSVRLALTSADIEWGCRDNFFPDWAYYGLLTGTPAEAASFLHQLMTTDLLPRHLLEEIANPIVISDAPIPGRLWQRAGYGLGVMTGSLGNAGRVIGHSGSGPGSACAIYHVLDSNEPRTTALFVDINDEAIAERLLVDTAMRAEPGVAQSQIVPRSDA